MLSMATENTLFKVQLKKTLPYIKQGRKKYKWLNKAFFSVSAKHGTKTSGITFKFDRVICNINAT